MEHKLPRQLTDEDDLKIIRRAKFNTLKFSGKISLQAAPPKFLIPDVEIKREEKLDLHGGLAKVTQTNFRIYVEMLNQKSSF